MPVILCICLTLSVVKGTAPLAAVLVVRRVKAQQVICYRVAARPIGPRTLAGKIKLTARIRKDVLILDSGYVQRAKLQNMCAL